MTSQDVDNILQIHNPTEPSRASPKGHYFWFGALC
jgi:hypothetical protein